MIRSENINNVFIFMPDSLRWDYRGPFIDTDGTAVKTVAQSTYTYVSMPSMFTGYIPQRHGMYSQHHSLQCDPDVESLFALNSHNTYLKANSLVKEHFGDTPDGAWHHIDEEHDQSHIGKLEPPFLYFAVDTGGHAPYDNGKNYEACLDFLRDTANEPQSEYKNYYRRSIISSAARFNRRLSELEQRGLRDSTLVIVMSDHGEHLWEYGGLVDHVHPVTPELVYVPTILYHPDINDDDLPTYIQHVDLLPTVFDILGIEDEFQRDGESFLSSDYRPRPAPNLTQFHPGKLSRVGYPSLYTQESIWDHEGGHVFNQQSTSRRLISYLMDQALERKAMGGRWRGYHQSTLRQTLPLYLSQYIKHGAPNMPKTVAKTILDDVESLSGATESLTAETEQQLEELGYL